MINTILLLLKLVTLLGIVFAYTVDMILMLSGLLLLLIILPRARTAIRLLQHSGYMCSTSGEVFSVNEADRVEALSRGFRELPIFSTATLIGEYPVWTRGG